jgi:uncharacterized Zn finger protein (UPF0148 family)
MSQLSTDESVDTLEAGHTLTAFDRCDSCGAQAYVRVTLSTGELLFCAHHGAKFKEKLAVTALNWHDESDRLSTER